MSEVVKVQLNGQDVELPVVTGTENEKAFDITKLRAETGYVTIDSGYGNTGACTSAITFLNGEKGILRYRGYPIEQLAEKSNFIEVAYLLYNGNLPSKSELEAFEKKIASYTELADGLKTLVDSFPVDAHPMGVLASASAAMSAYYPQFLNADTIEAQADEVLPLMMGQIHAVMTRFHAKTQGKEVVAYDASKSYSENFLMQMFGNDNAEIADALSKLLILHADHEQNCSTSTVRMVGSANTNIFATISAGCDALWGPLHGGANQAVLEMLEAIQNDGGDHKQALANAKDKANPFRLMGFGHRVYKNFDPRATIIKGACDTVLAKLGVQDPLLDIAKGLEEEALKDEYFVARKLYPNVDFYSGVIYKALGIPTNMFTGMFVLGRLPGWMAQWKEMRTNPGRICRPRQIYTGENERDYVSLSER